MNGKDPKTPAEWQESVDIGSALLVIHELKTKGLMKGGPDVNAARCNELVARGSELGIRPSKDPGDLAIEYVRKWNQGRAAFVRMVERN